MQIDKAELIRLIAEELARDATEENHEDREKVLARIVDRVNAL